MNQETHTIITLFWSQLLIVTALSMCLAYVLNQILKKIARMFSIPKRIKTHDGYLYRSLSGVYVPKQELEYNDVGYIYNKKKYAISLLERRISILRKQCDQIETKVHAE